MTKNQRHKTRLSATILLAFLLTLLIPNCALAITGHMSFWSAITNTVLPAGIIALLASISIKAGRTIWMMFPLTFLAAFQIVLLCLYGRSIIAVDMFLNLTTTNSGEVAELLGNLWPAVLLVVVLYLPPLVGATWMMACNRNVSPVLTSRLRRGGIIATILGCVSLVAAYATGPYSILSDLYPANVFYNIGLAIDRTVKTARYPTTSADFTFAPVADNDSIQQKVVVLVIGETSRAENWSLCGYSRNTNPQLSSVDSLLISHTTLSESNTTHKSVPMLLSHVDATTFDSIYHIKSVITAFKEAGYATAFFSNQRPNGSFIDFFADEADTTLFIREDGVGNNGSSSDIELIKHLGNSLSHNPRRQLIVLHTYGSHFNYNERYDSIDRHFTPDDYPEAAPDYRDNLLNAYDNTIVATDRFLAAVINTLNSHPDLSATMLYTSDHGEDIYDDERKLFLHASPLPTWHQINVPFIVWMSPRYRSSHPGRYDIIADNLEKPISSSRSFFHTALGLGDISTPVFNPEAAVTSGSYTPRPKPLYLNDHNRAISHFESAPLTSK